MIQRHGMLAFFKVVTGYLCIRRPPDYLPGAIFPRRGSYPAQNTLKQVYVSCVSVVFVVLVFMLFVFFFLWCVLF